MNIWKFVAVSSFLAVPVFLLKSFDAPCETSDECVGKLTCKYYLRPCPLGRCLCDRKIDFYSASNEQCIKRVFLGQKCSNSHTQCAGSNSYCTPKKICRCPDGYQKMSDKLGCRDPKTMKVIGESCDAKQSCFVYINGTFKKSFACSENKCLCNSGERKIKLFCEPVIPGDKCTNQSDCFSSTVGTMQCTKGKCSCSGMRVYHSMMKSCVTSKEGTKGSRCNVSHSCIDGLVCATCPNAVHPTCLKITARGTYLYSSKFGTLLLTCMVLAFM